jgi:hypothetical protein
MTDEVARLRENAAHCRRLAEIASDERIIAELVRCAEEFDEEADKLEVALRSASADHPLKPR